MEFDAIQDDETKYKYFEHYCIQSSTLSHEKFDAEYFLSLEEEEDISEEIIPDKPVFLDETLGFGIDNTIQKTFNVLLNRNNC